MDTLHFTFFIWLVGIAGGLLGAMTGLGGVVIIIPVLTLLFGVDIRYAMGASLISVIATSSGAASVFVREGFSNIRAGMFLEMATTAGAIIGALLTAMFAPALIAVIFGLILLFSAYLSLNPPADRVDRLPDSFTARFRMNGSYPTAEGKKEYSVHNVTGGFSLMFAAGALSGLLGIGSGAMKVLAMDRVMRMPFKVSTTTSNFMIGVTAAASAGIYIARGYIEPPLVMPVILGVLPGSMLGAFILRKAPSKKLRMVFAFAILALGLEMLYKGFTGRF